MNNCFSTMLEATRHLEKKGFSDSFALTKDGLHSYTTKKNYQPSDLTIVEFHRFEGIANLEDMSILYALETNDDKKGIIIDAFGTYADASLGEFIKKIKYKDQDRIAVEQE